MWRKYVKMGRGTLSRGKGGGWKLFLSVDGKGTCRGMATRDRTEAERRRDEAIETIRQRRIDKMSRIPLLGYWTSFAGSPCAVRISEDGMRRRFKAWLDFASWMQENHPQVCRVEDVTRALAVEYVNWRSVGIAGETANKVVFMLRGVFGILRSGGGDGGNGADNPFEHLAAIKPDGHPRRGLSRNEIARLLNEAAHMGREYRVLVLIAAYTGLRLGECCNLMWTNIDTRKGILQFAPGKTRRYMRGRLVTIPIHWRLLKTLLEVPPEQRNGAVLLTLHTRYSSTPHRVSGDLARLFSAAGIETSVNIPGRRRRTPEASFHSLRHSFVSFAANSGVPLESLRYIVGHRSTAMTRHYYHADEERLRMAVAAIPEFDALGNIVHRSGDKPVFFSRELRERALSQRLRDVQTLLDEGLISEKECNDLCLVIAAEA